MKKAGQMHDKNRDITHLNIVIKLFIGFLRSVSELVDMSCL